MKRVVLIRHAKSSWKDMSLDDFDRPLNKRGKRDAPVIASYMKEQGVVLDKIFASSAKRARKTAKVFAEVLDAPLELHEHLYTDSREELISFIEEKLKKYDTIAIVSHNPELTELANFLITEHIENIPTSAYVVLELENKGLEKDSCKLVNFIYPKKL